MKQQAWKYMAELLLGDVIEKLVSQPRSEDQAQTLIAALGLVVERLEKKFSIAAVEEDRASRECCKATREACAKIAAKYFDSGEIVDEIRALTE